MATTKVTKGVIADNAVGIDQLDVTDGSNGQVLSTNGSGTLSFTTISGYTDSDVETYLDSGTSTPTFGAMNTNGAITLGNASYWIGNATNGYRFNNSADTLNLLVIKDNGNVGIGTNNPTGAKLHVTGGIKATDLVAHDSTGINLQTDEGTKRLVVTDTGNITFPGQTTTFDDTGFTHHTNNLLYLRGGSAGLILSDDTGINTIQIFDGVGGYINFETSDGSSKMRLTSTGNLGVGHLTPQFRITLPQASDDSGKIGWEDGSENKRASILCNSSNDRLEFRTGTSDTLRMSIHGTNEDIHIGEGTSDVLLYIGSQGGAYGGNNSNWIRGSGGALMYNSGNGSHIWEATGSQKMQLKNDGTLLINRTSSFGSTSSASMIVTGQSASCAYWTAPNTAGYDIHTFFNGGLGVIGIIEQNSTLNGVSYNTSSDYRLKENVNYDWDATSIVKQLKPAEYNFISDPNNTYQQGFIAHELAEHLPFAVSGEKDAVIPAVLYQETDQEVIDGEALVGDIKEEEKIKPQQVDYSKVVALLVKTIQELEARIATLESA